MCCSCLRLRLLAPSTRTMCSCVMKSQRTRSAALYYSYYSGILIVTTMSVITHSSTIRYLLHLSNVIRYLQETCAFKISYLLFLLQVQHFVHCIETHGRHVQYLRFLQTIVKCDSSYIRKSQDTVMSEVSKLIHVL